MSLSDHFSEAELITHTGEPILDNDCPDSLAGNAIQQAEMLEECRVLVGPMSVHSWYRSPAVNTAVRGEPTSYHLLALATDFVVNGSVFSAFKTIVASDIQYDKIIFEHRNSDWIHIQSAKPGGVPRRQAMTSHLGPNDRMVYEVFNA